VVEPCSLTCNPTRTLPNQVSYLKGSAMESFILWPTPKIDFRCSAATANLQWLQSKLKQLNNLQNNFSEHLWNSIPNSCSSQCPGASIYRLRCRMGDCSDICGRRLDGQLCDIIFWDFPRKSFLFKSRVRTVRHCHPDGRTSTASNFLIRLRASGPWGMSV
jgi:hypothetical protein